MGTDTQLKTQAVTALRAKCENFARCGTTGHFQDKGQWVRCPCMKLEISKRKLGIMFSEKPEKDTALESQVEENLLLEGSLSALRPHIACVLTKMLDRGQSWIAMDAYRLIEIFLDQDKEHETTSVTVDADLLILMIGFGDPRNRYLPELVIQALSRRELLGKPTWVLLGLDLDMVPVRYSTDLFDKLKNLKKVKVR